MLDNPIARRILILAVGDLRRLTKPAKLAATLSAAGHEVIRLGFKARPGEPDSFNSPYGRVVLLDPIPPFPAAHSAQGEGAPGRPQVPSAREAIKRVLLKLDLGRWLQRHVIRLRLIRSRRRLIHQVVKRNTILSIAASELSPDLVISSQMDVLPAGAQVSEGLGIPLVYDVRDVLTVSGHYPWTLRRFRKQERALIGKADLVTAVSPQMADYLEDSYGIPKPLVLYNSGTVRAESASYVHSPVKLLFQGYFSPILDLPDLVRAMTMLRGVAVLTLQGEGAEGANLRALVAELGLNDLVTFKAFVPPEQAALDANAHDIGVINYRAKTLNLEWSLPNKLFDYLGGGLAVLSSDLPAIRAIIEEGDCGVVFEPAGPEAIAGAVRRIAAQPERILTMKHNAIETWDAYSWGKQEATLHTEIDRLLRKKEPVLKDLPYGR